MLKKILTPEQCAKCRICCGFTEGDKWEIPLLAGDEERKAALALGDVEDIPGTNCAVFSMNFSGDELVYCPAAGENGCRLGEKRPFDCRIWPFRVMKLDRTLVITLSPVCPEVQKLPLEALTEFVSGDFSEMLFRHAEEYPETVKPYINGYPVLCVREK